MSFFRRDYNFDNSSMLLSEGGKMSPLRKIRNVLKPLLKIVRKKRCTRKTLAEILDNDYNTSLEEIRSVASSEEMDQNAANEQLEQDLLNDLPVRRQRCIPVHYARTEVGTFFWTSTHGSN